MSAYFDHFDHILGYFLHFFFITQNLGVVTIRKYTKFWFTDDFDQIFLNVNPEDPKKTYKHIVLQFKFFKIFICIPPKNAGLRVLVKTQNNDHGTLYKRYDFLKLTYRCSSTFIEMWSLTIKNRLQNHK